MRSARREEETVMRSHVAANLEHDLGVRPQAQQARVHTSPYAGDINGDRPAEREEPTAAKPLTPGTEHAPERHATGVVDDAARIERPHTGTAAGGHNATEALARAPYSDSGRDDDHASASEQLEMNPRASLERLAATDEAGGRRPRRRVIARTGTDGRRNDPGQYGGRRNQEPSREHRRQAMRGILCLLACALAAGYISAPARADGDPASDYLIGQQVFLGYDAKIPASLESKLVAAVASANKNGFPVKVALIWSRYDMGSVPELFNKPQTYARFLDAEDSKCWWGGACGSGRFKTTTRLVVVMPDGLGFAQWKHSPKAGYRTLAGIRVTQTPSGLATAATTAVVKLASAAGVKVSTRGGSRIPTGTGGGSNSVEIIVAVVVALLIGVAARLLIRRRAARSAAR
jgi:hypothetical protein